MKFARTLLVAVAAAAVLGASAGAATPTTVMFPMKALNASGETGTATVTQVATGVKVVVSLKGAPATAQPTHIHVGTCDNINKAPKYPLANTVNGKSTTVVKGVTLAQLLAGHYAVNVHKSATAIGTYVSCGNIK
ncbi:MAG TPA: hypothetical protein VMW12_10365 [Candidatus Dormibacteraeota bacterium]|nr:hypothetical protein [Candidatus Dormibacteraeota bacterium]